ADRDEESAQHERDHDPDQEHLLAVSPRHREPAHDEQEDEQVVGAERVFGEPAGEELPSVTRPRHEQQSRPEAHGQEDVERHPERALPEGRLTRIPRHEPEIERYDDRESHNGHDPDPCGQAHLTPSSRAAGARPRRRSLLRQSISTCRTYDSNRRRASGLRSWTRISYRGVIRSCSHTNPMAIPRLIGPWKARKGRSRSRSAGVPVRKALVAASWQRRARGKPASQYRPATVKTPGLITPLPI